MNEMPQRAIRVKPKVKTFSKGNTWVLGVARSFNVRQLTAFNVGNHTQTQEGIEEN